MFHSIGVHRTFGLPKDDFPPENTTQKHHGSSVWTLDQFFGLTGERQRIFLRMRITDQNGTDMTRPVP
jgi:hypothetical protein